MATSPADDFAAGVLTVAGAGATLRRRGILKGSKSEVTVRRRCVAAFALATGAGSVAGDFVSRSSSGARPMALSPPDDTGLVSPPDLAGSASGNPPKNCQAIARAGELPAAGRFARASLERQQIHPGIRFDCRNRDGSLAVRTATAPAAVLLLHSQNGAAARAIEDDIHSAAR